jgi:hypothetical protein
MVTWIASVGVNYRALFPNSKMKSSWEFPNLALAFVAVRTSYF